MDLNRAQLIGNVTKDPECRTTPSGKQVASFSIATNSQWKDASGQIQKRAEFHSVVAWGKLADICVQYMYKGSRVFVEGALQTREWQSQDGQKRTRTEIVMENMILLDRKRTDGSPSSQGTTGQAPQGPHASTGGLQPPTGPVIDPGGYIEDIRLEDIPF